jgi:hypothetical protein
MSQSPFLGRMFRLLLVIAALCASPALPRWIPVHSIAEARGGAVHVRGYVRKDGTYVPPHYRSAPDGNFYNNWSTKGNVNPYTGEPGTKVSRPSTYGQDVHVNGYVRSNGTYVPPHYRSAPDGDPSNNWSTEGNVNPYTGEEGTESIGDENPSDGGRADADDDADADDGNVDGEGIGGYQSRPAYLPPGLALQVALVFAGENPGPIDGIVGRQTVAAFARYARAGDGPRSAHLGMARLASQVRPRNAGIAQVLDNVAETLRAAEEKATAHK